MKEYNLRAEYWLDAVEHAMQISIEEDCSNAGIMGYVTGITGCVQVNEVLKIILQSEDVLSGEILIADFEKMLFRKFRIKNKHAGI